MGETAKSTAHSAPITLALFQPDIPQNAGTILRMAACLAVPAAIIEPAGFPTSDRAFRRAGMDYLDHVDIRRHASWNAFNIWLTETGRRLVLATTRAAGTHHDFAFQAGDVLLFGRETNGVPDEVHDRADQRITIPMVPHVRSLNLAVAAAILTGEALRQLDAYPRRMP